jgi:hypothetical protein
MKKVITAIAISVFLFGFCQINAYDSGKNPVKAMLLSAGIPGGGQFYNEAYYKATFVLAVEGYFIGRLIYHHNQVRRYAEKTETSVGDDFLYNESQYNRYYKRRQNDFWWVGSILLLSAVDAFVDAHLFNYDREKQKVHMRFEDQTIGIGFSF